MSPMSEDEPQHLLVGVVGLEEGAVHRHVGLRTSGRLDVGVLRAEQLFGSFDGEGLGNVDVLASAVVPPAWIALRVLVVHGRGERRQYGGAGVVLGCDEPKRGPFAVELGRERRGHLWIGSLQRSPIGGKLSHRSPPLAVRSAPSRCAAPGSGSNRRSNSCSQSASISQAVARNDSTLPP